jgi:hypothetical protein
VLVNARDVTVVTVKPALILAVGFVDPALNFLVVAADLPGRSEGEAASYRSRTGNGLKWLCTGALRRKATCFPKSRKGLGRDS